MPIKFSLVVPTYNEAANILQLYQRIINTLDSLNFDFEIVIVDDNSPDNTWCIANTLAKQDSRIRLIHRISQRGLASAVVDGWAASQGEVIGVIDADLQHPPETLKEMIHKMLNDPEVDR